MRPIKDLEELKNIELDILKYIHKVCEENGLIYYLAGGSLLGAVRHKGFIPWDDDVDLLMPRKDYEKLVQIINRDSSHYKMLCLKSDKHYLSTFAKVIDTRTKIQFKAREISESKELGVFVDIFPMDGAGNDYKKACRRLERLFKYYQMFILFRCSSKDNRLNRFLCNMIVIVLEILAKRYPYEKTKYVGRIVNTRGACELMRNTWFKRRILLDFETEKFYGPAGYHYYLKGLYGEYMKCPPASQQRLTHSFQAWWK